LFLVDDVAVDTEGGIAVNATTTATKTRTTTWTLHLYAAV